MKLKLPSLAQVYKNAIDTLKEFPLPLLISIIGTVAGMMLIESKGSENEDLFKIIMTSALGLPLLLGVKLWLKSNNKNLVFSLVTNSIAVGFLVLYYFSFPEKPSETEFIQFFVLGLSLHFWVSFAPYLNNSGLNGYWQFNKTLFIRILTVFLFSIIIYLGLTSALAVSDELFGLNINGKTYGKLWVFIVGIFNTWMFLGGIPLDFQKLEEEQSYPKGLKMFTQFVLLPLVFIYLGILYVYLLKIIISWSLPKGLVSWLVNIFSVLGILSFLLIYPLRLNKENKWISLFSRWFFLALYPLIGLLLVAILTRVFAYGITENRYFVLLIASWLALIGFYYLIKGFHKIKIIPISLFIFGIVAAIGPFSAVNVSIKNQSSRLHEKLNELKMIQDGTIIKQDTLVLKSNGETVDEIYSIVHYLAKKNELKPFEKMLKDTLDENKSNEFINYYNEADRFLSAIGINDYDHNYNTVSDKSFTLVLNRKENINTRGASIIHEFDEYDLEKNNYEFVVDKDSSSSNMSIDIKALKKSYITKLKPYLSNRYDYYYTIENENDMFLKLSDQDEIIGFRANQISFHLTKNNTSVTFINGYLLIK